VELSLVHLPRDALAYQEGKVEIVGVVLDLCQRVVLENPGRGRGRSR
jgi:hypothetical protein